MSLSKHKVGFCIYSRYEVIVSSYPTKQIKNINFILESIVKQKQNSSYVFQKKRKNNYNCLLTS